MKYTATDTTLVIETEDAFDTLWLSDKIDAYSDDEILSHMSDEFGWLGNQGPQPIPTPGLSEAPTLALGVEHTDEGRMDYESAYAYLAYESTSWASELMVKGKVIFSKV